MVDKTFYFLEKKGNIQVAFYGGIGCVCFTFKLHGKWVLEMLAEWNGME